MGTDFGTCTCGALVIWAKTQSGARMPLNAEPDIHGDVVLCMGIVYVLRDDQDPQTPGRYQSHWNVCPDSPRHRRPRQATPKAAPAQPIAQPDPEPAPPPKRQAAPAVETIPGFDF